MDLQERVLGWTCLICIRVGTDIFTFNDYIYSYILLQIKMFEVWRSVTLRRHAMFLLTYGI
jgi:hypothetical protein